VTSAAIKLDQVTKTFDGRVMAVDGVTLDIAAGEFFSLLGPSGCGKTTSLRMIAGFEHPDSGRVHVGGRDITDLPVHRRDMGMVFQSYALFPHRTVAENVAFGLRMREVAKPEIERRVAAALAQVALTVGADDLDGVTTSDEAPDGKRRAPLEEVRRNITAAALQPAERDGRFDLR